ncbi:MAG: rod shape-determining protein MreC [Acidobacteriota bacterium]|nr:rod shape-determining protein MreC [Acidobacteriota bacterium]
MHAVERPLKMRARPPLYVTAALLLLALMLLPTAARAQWTQPDASNNIHSTNSGNVGVGTGTNAPASRLEVFNPTGGSSSVNYFQVTGATADNSNYPAMQLKGGTLATEFPQFRLGNGGLGLNLFGGRSSTYGNRMGLWLSSNSSASAYASVQKFDGTATTDLLVVRDSGSVGIGTPTPGYRLHIAGDNTSTGGYPVIKFENTQTGGHSWWLYAGAWGVPGAFGIYDETAQKYRLFFDASGNAGMGTLSPAFDANGSKYLALDSGSTTLATLGVGSTQSDANAALGYLSFFNSSLATTEKRNASIVGANDGATNSGNLQFYTANTGALTERMRIDKGGNVGIGTASPQNALTLARPGSAPSASRPASELLQLVDKADNTPQILFATAFNGMQLRYTGTDGTAANQRLGVITGGAGEAFVVNNDGKVGIGTTNPGANYKLDVNGNANITGTLNATGAITGATVNATYQDVAEWVPSTQKLAAGTVVVLDTARTNHVLASTKAYDTSVAGVVSDTPGVILGQGSADKLKVATTGRVKVRVDATGAPIKVGDLLVTSGVEGVAMKSIPVDLGGAQIHRPGTIIGKALEPLDKGTGEILVLLSLQ